MAGRSSSAGPDDPPGSPASRLHRGPGAVDRRPGRERLLLRPASRESLDAVQRDRSGPVGVGATPGRVPQSGNRCPGLRAHGSGGLSPALHTGPACATKRLEPAAPPPGRSTRAPGPGPEGRSAGADMAERLCQAGHRQDPCRSRRPQLKGRPGSIKAALRPLPGGRAGPRRRGRVAPGKRRAYVSTTAPSSSRSCWPPPPSWPYWPGWPDSGRFGCG